MKNSMAIKFAFKNLKANKLLLTPFLISSSIMAILLNIMTSLITNEFVKTRHNSLPLVMAFGIVLVGIFTVVFMIYSNNFMTKRRNKEFALYGILGLEKRHISKIILIETIINYLTVSFFSILGGFAFGKTTFVFLARIIKEIPENVSSYSFSVFAMVVTLIFLAVVFLIIYIISVVRVGISTPMELLSKQKKAEGEPKSKWIITLIGLGFLGYGYFLALTTKGVLKSLLVFFLAVLLVILGTYCLFTSLSIIVLKMLKKRENFYYKSKNFISISGMLYRMKSNAISLASIAILSTSIIVALSATTTIFKGFGSVIDSVMPTDYKIDDLSTVKNEEITKSIVEKRKEIVEIINKSLKDDEKVKNLKISESYFTPVGLDKNRVIPYAASLDKKAYYIIVELLDSYNKNNNTNYELKEGEILYSSNVDSIKELKELTFVNKNFNLIAVPLDVPKNLVGDFIKVVVKDFDSFEEFAKYYVNENRTDETVINFEAYWDIENLKDGYYNRLKTHADEYSFRLDTRESFAKSIYELNGGFLFLGIIVSTIFIVGTTLLTYYKQISEGFDDRENYQILKKVGLPDKLIKKSLKAQIIWIFFLPLLVSSIHALVASKIIFQLLGLFGITEIGVFAVNLIIIMGIFAVVYYLIYIITSRIYYKIVS